MTKTTDSRQISLLIGGILQHYKIDDLQLEIDLSSAVKRYFDERYKSTDKADIRARILKDMEIAAVKAMENETMCGRIKQALGFEPNGRHEELISWLITKDKSGQSIEKFRAWWDKENEFKRPALWKFGDRPTFLKEVWVSAFPNEASGLDKYDKALLELQAAVNG